MKVVVAPAFVILLTEIAMMRRSDHFKVVLKGGHVVHLDNPNAFDKVFDAWMAWLRETL